MTNPTTTTYEFLGPIGAFIITFAVPTLTYAIYFTCSEQAGGCPPINLALPTNWSQLWDTEAFVYYLAWYSFCIIAWAILPGDWVNGVILRTGERKQYKINGTTSSLFVFFLLPDCLQPSRHSYSCWASRWVISSDSVQVLSPSSITNGSVLSQPQ